MTSPSPSKFLYFAYGSNLHSERIHQNNPTAVQKSLGVLDNHQLEFAHWSKKWEGAVANIVPHPTRKVHGVVWELDFKDLKSLDRQEGVGIGIYERFKIQVNVEKERLDCWTYKLTPETRDKSIVTHGQENLKPSVEYKAVILRGASENNLDLNYVQFLKNISCHEPKGSNV